jgi:Saxitoxin biosynthesis operon protein SxtJ
MQENVTIRQLRSFSFLVGTVFVVLGLWPFIIRGQSMRLWALILAGLLIIPGAVWPTALKPVYRVWMTVGHTLGWVNTRIILAVIFYVIFAPVAIVMRLLRNDPLRRKLDPTADTYRIRRLPRSGSHMNRQF